jgi:hypothetical protein
MLKVPFFLPQPYVVIPFCSVISQPSTHFRFCQKADLERGEDKLLQMT